MPSYWDFLAPKNENSSRKKWETIFHNSTAKAWIDKTILLFPFYDI